MAGDRIQIDGLKEFRKALKETNAELPRALRIAFNKSVQVVIDEARPKVPKGKTGAAASSIRAQSSQTSAKIVAGGRKAPYYPWLDFGGRVGKRRQISRPFIADGRYIYAAYFNKKQSGEFVQILAESLTEVAHEAGLVIE